jgi:3-deoxy-D-manno-octulosonic-acid transferase
LSLDVIYLIIPRHPERFSLLAEMLEKRLIKYIRRSQNKPLAKDDKIIIGDSMGEMLAYYAISEIVIIGGSINDFGGQNPLEAFFMDKPVLFGKSMYNFSKIAKDSLDTGCAIQFDNIQNLKKIIDDLLINDDLYCQLKNKCKLFMDKYQGASQKICDIVNKDL